eukprot:6859094-Alexandrium_andersonii.AAC.1
MPRPAVWLPRASEQESDEGYLERALAVAQADDPPVGLTFRRGGGGLPWHLGRRRSWPAPLLPFRRLRGWRRAFPPLGLRQ